MKIKKMSAMLLVLPAILLMGCPNRINNDAKNLDASIPVAGDTLRANGLIDTLKSNLPELMRDIPNRALSISDITTVPQTRLDLENMRSVVKVIDSKDNAGLEIPGFGGLKLGQDQSSISVYYVETKTVISTAGDTAVYGVGYSIHYLFKKVKKGINVANLPYVAASVQLDGNKTQVLYSLQTYGIIGQPLVRYFKPVVNKPFDVEGYGIIQSSIDGIHNVLGDEALQSTVRFKPVRLTNVKASDLRR